MGERAMAPETTLEALWLTCCATVGLPVNLVTLWCLLAAFRRRRTSVTLLHIMLNLSDIGVLLFFALGYTAWLVSYDWPWGDAACRFMRFMDNFVFASSSNVMMCIAFARLRALRSPLHGRARRLAVALASAGAWTLAALVSLPQLFFWRVVETPDMEQCVSVWKAQALAGAANLTTVSINAYSLYHLATIFWVPMVTLTVLYALILRGIYQALSVDRATTAAYHAVDGGDSADGQGLPGAVRVSVRRDSADETRRQHVKAQSLKVTLGLITAYMLIWLPYNVVSLWSVFAPASYLSTGDHLYGLTRLIVLNSVINPFIYGRTKLVQSAKFIRACMASLRRSMF